MSGSGELFLEQVREVQSRDNLGILVTSSYFGSQMSRPEANAATWNEFSQRMNPLATIALNNSGVECVVTAKTVPWGTEDVNIFAGEDGRALYELDDFDVPEGEAFLDLNFTLAERLLHEHAYEGVQVTVGFNRKDLSAGHHSVLKLHSHVRVAPSAQDVARRQPVSWQSLNRFDKLAFIEPFASLHHDYITRAVQDGCLAPFLVDAPKAGVGYTSLTLERTANLPKMFDQLKSLYIGMKAEYDAVADIFTDGSMDTVTGKLIPREREERRARLETFLVGREGFYSAQSVRVLKYLAEHIRPAEPRDPHDPLDMRSTAMMYLSTGFAGAITYAFERHSDTVRLDFLPRVITTSTPTKTMMGEALPTVIERTDTPATEQDRRIMTEYHQRVLRILETTVPASQFKRGEIL